MLSVLTYPVEQPYRIRWITELFYAGSTVLIVLLVMFNLVVSGYDTVTVIMPDPNITDPSQWWAPNWVPEKLRIIRTSPGECQPAVLPFNTGLRTNSSLPLFTYTLSNTLSQHGPQESYKANSLESCRVQYMSMSIYSETFSLNVYASLTCNMPPNTTRPRQFAVNFSSARDTRFQYDTVIEYMALQSLNVNSGGEFNSLSREGPPNETFLNVLGVVDALSSDMTQLLWIQWIHWSANGRSKSTIPETGYISWGTVSESPYDPEALGIGASSNAMTVYYSDEEDDSYFRNMNTTVGNLFVAIRDAIHLDVGYVEPSNIYINRTMFRKLITPDDYFHELVSSMPPDRSKDDDFSSVSWGWGWAPGDNASWAQAFASTNQPVNNITLPIKLPSPNPPSVIDIMYLCPQYRLKSWGSLFMALFTGTFTTYASLYGLFAWLGPAVDRKRNGPQPLELLVDQHSNKTEPEEFHLLVPDFRSSKSSLDLEGSVQKHLFSDDLKK